MKTMTTTRARMRSIIGLATAIMLLAGLALAQTYPAMVRTSYDKMMASGKQPKVTTMRLDPIKGWTNSGVFLKKGDMINISADGRIDPGVRLSRGPDGAGRDQLKELTHECAYMELIGRLGDGSPVCVGSNSTFEVLEGGQLSFRVNELDALRYDDLGYFDLQIRVIEAAAATAATGARLTAILDLVPVNISADEARVLSMALRTHLGATGRYTIIDQSQVDQTVRQMGIRPTDLSNVQTAVRIGRALKADQVVIGQVGKVGSGYTVTLQRVNPNSGAVDNTVVDTYNCTREQLAGQLAASARKL